ncbi:hypothetical protein K501DRAFT_322635 [Backusella circina FSU 941]|nr:hypothetical protein K501DRAFT_322635 [Backusella circina FSU 941]
MEDCIREITETGETQLDPFKLKLIKKHLKHSNEHIDIAFDLIQSQLQKQHAEIRYSTLQLIEVLFHRSKRFRELLTEDLPLFLQLTVGIKSSLPPPVKVAYKLKKYAVALMKDWYTRFNQFYRSLGIAYDFLLENGFLNGSDQSLYEIHAQERRQANNEARIQANHQIRYNILRLDIMEHKDLVMENIEKMKSCFEILIPRNFEKEGLDFDSLLRGEPGPNQIQNDHYTNNSTSYGLGSSRYTITIEMSKDDVMQDIEETEENKIVFDQLRESFTVLETNYSKQLNKWINTLIKLDLIGEYKSEKQQLIKELISLKANLTEELDRAKLLGIEAIEKIPIQQTNSDDDDEFGDEDFEDIEVKPLQQNDTVGPSSSKLPPTQRIFPLSFEPGMIQDATYGGPVQRQVTEETKKDKGKQKVDPRREELLKRAPVIEWGDDLYYWDKKTVQFNTSGIEKSHRFMGVGEGSNEMPEHLLEELRKRPIYFKSDKQDEIMPCKHPLRNGGLCPRKDLVTCPFHGKIIPRDDDGEPLDNNASSSSKVTHNVNDRLWELLENDVMKQMGKDTIDPKRGKRKNNLKKSNLADIKKVKKPEDSYARLEQKLNTPAMKKVVKSAFEYERELKAQNKSSQFK